MIFRLAFIAGAVILSGCSSEPTQTKVPFPFDYGDQTIIQAPLVSHVIEFESDSSQLNDTHKEALKPHIDHLVIHPWNHVRLQGRSDAQGDINTNHSLALKRAEAVKQYFIVHGIEEDQIMISSVGEMANATLPQRSVVIAY